MVDEYHPDKTNEGCEWPLLVSRLAKQPPDADSVKHISWRWGVKPWGLCTRWQLKNKVTAQEIQQATQTW